MATKEKEVLPRVLVKNIPSVYLIRDGSDLVSLGPPSSSGWEIITGVANVNFGVWTGYIDLTGMTMTQGLSCAVQTVDIQESDIWISDNDLTNVWDVVSDVPINWEEALNKFDGVRLCMPGMPGSGHNLENIISGTSRMFLRNTAIVGGTVPGQRSAWGVNAATASRRIYVSRVFTVQNEQPIPTTAYSPPTAIAMPVLFFDEENLSHLERLRKSTVLQQ